MRLSRVGSEKWRRDRKAYTELQFAYQLKQILQGTLTDVLQIKGSVNNFYRQGLVQKSDVLNAEVQVNTVESTLSKPKAIIKIHSEEFILWLVNPKNNPPFFSRFPLYKKSQKIIFLFFQKRGQTLWS